MKSRNTTRRVFATTAVFGVLAIVCAIWGAKSAQAIIIIGTKTGLFGVTTGQTIRDSILNSALTKGGVQPCVGIFDINGNRLARFEGMMPLMLGHGTFFDFDATTLNMRMGERAQLRVQVELEQPPDPASPRAEADDVLITVEVFDNVSGKTVFTVPATTKGFNPQPEPPASV